MQMKADNMNESIPPLPVLEISALARKNVGQQNSVFIDQQNMDHAMRIIYERRPDFFLISAERDKKWERDKTQDDPWFHDGFNEELQKFIREEISKEVKVPTLIAVTQIIGHARAVARLMYG
jgi:hypothetical protein